MAEARERDLVLAPNEFAFILDNSKGTVSVYSGPCKTSISDTDVPVRFDNVTKRFVNSRNLEEAKQKDFVAPEGWYVVLKNPAQNGTKPESGKKGDIPDLSVGHKVNIPGPTAFSLWPMQMAKVIQGHHLRHNQYLLCRVYNDEAISDSEAVIKMSENMATESTETKEKDSKKQAKEDQKTVAEVTKKRATGQYFIVQGTDVSFYIPPTGVEVLKEIDNSNVDTNGYIRNAVTLETLEYCILKDENGEKRYVQGPAVVFPRPTEVFITKDKNNKRTRKFLAIELNDLSGLYIRVIEDYKDDGKDYKKGQELFITGKDQAIYYQRKEHMIVKYGDSMIHYAVAIPEGEARYVLDRNAGKVSLTKGPKMFLPDPRTEVVVRRVLDNGQVMLYYPGNKEALQINADLAKNNEDVDNIHSYMMNDRSVLSNSFSNSSHKKSKRGGFADEALLKSMSSDMSDGIVDQFDRGTEYTPPRTITLNNKYQGAVGIDIWNNFAVQVVSKTGNRKVVTGPSTYLLEYDEVLEPVSLSKGSPKSLDNGQLKTVYLKTKDNRVKDLIQAETKDFCNVNIELAYSVNFEGDSKKWFDVDNYVQLLSDRMTSIINNAIKKIGIQEFYENSTDIIRDLILGKTEKGNRAGKTFSENGMVINDVEVFAVDILNESIEGLLINTKRNTVIESLKLEQQKDHFKTVKEIRSVELETAKLEDQTSIALAKFEEAKIERVKANKLLLQASNDEVNSKIYLSEVDANEHASLLRGIVLEKQKLVATHELQVATDNQKLDVEKIREISKAKVDELDAVQNKMVAALTSMAETGKLQALAEFYPSAIVENTSIANVAQRLLEGTNLSGILPTVTEGNKVSKSKKG